MKSISKIFASITATAAIVASMGINVFAEDVDFDMAKAHWTAGGSVNNASSYVCGTRLSNERRDSKNFNPMWITSDSEVILTYEIRENKDSNAILTDADTSKVSAPPAELIMQTWKGDLVDSTEERMQHVIPSSWTATTCTFTYNELVEAWGRDDFSNVYSFQVCDNTINPLMVTSMMITNCDIPEEDMVAGIRLGTILKDGKEVVIEPEVTTTVEDPTAKTETAESASNESGSTESTSETTQDPAENEGPNITLIAIIAGAVVVVGVVVGIIVKKSASSKSKGWH